MIKVQLKGGLGNQMFQYALGRYLCLKNNITLDLDLSFLFFKFDKEILNTLDNCFLKDYRQSEKYFKDVEGIIRNEFSIKFPVDSINKKMGEQIAREESVSIHIRRGDYGDDPITNQRQGVCGIDYFRIAINEIILKIGKPHFYIFSDGPSAAKDNISSEFPIDFVMHNDASKNYEDLRLMRLFQHRIITNSTFRRWGAWLSENDKKIVIAPKNWFNQPDIDTRDLIPDSWYKL